MFLFRGHSDTTSTQCWTIPNCQTHWFQCLPPWLATDLSLYHPSIVFLNSLLDQPQPQPLQNLPPVLEPMSFPPAPHDSIESVSYYQIISMQDSGIYMFLVRWWAASLWGNMAYTWGTSAPWSQHPRHLWVPQEPLINDHNHTTSSIESSSTVKGPNVREN